MPLSDHSGKNSFNLNNKSFINRGASGGTPIYDITSSGGSGGSGAALAGAVIEWGSQFRTFTVVRSFGLDTPVLYGQSTYVSGGSYNTAPHSFHFPLSSPIQDPIVNYKLDEEESLRATNVFYHESDPTSQLNSWQSGGNYGGYVSSGNITDIVFFNFSMPSSNVPAYNKLFLTIF